MSHHIVYRDAELTCIVGYDHKENAFTFEMRKAEVKNKCWYRIEDKDSLDKCFAHARNYGSVSPNVRKSVEDILMKEMEGGIEQVGLFSWEKDIPFEEVDFKDW